MGTYLPDEFQRNRAEIQNQFFQVHSHPLECTMWHRAEIPKKETENKAAVTKCRSSLSTSTKLNEEHASMSFFVTWMRGLEQCNVLIRKKDES
jgi:hypothetical protein